MVKKRQKALPKAKSDVVKPLIYSSPAIRARRHRILEETRKLISEQGLAGFSMDELGKRAGVAKRTLYNAFQSKEHTIAIAINEYFQEYISRIPYSSAQGTLQRNIERIVSVNRRNRQIRNYIRAIMSVYFSPDAHPEIWTTIHTIATKSNLEWIEKLEAKNQLQPWITAKSLADMVARYEYATINDWCQGRLDDDEMMPRMIMGLLMMMSGATTGAARREIDATLQHYHAEGIPMVPIPERAPTPAKSKKDAAA